uniref:Sorting nexin 19a n=1 Tax=Takifugu rubripes TaxID=31033 RepID=A0A674ND25_TAKRU
MMQSAKMSNNWTLSDVLGQRRVLGVGILLAWLVLFHLLVNVWLLCIFTSLLVVLGGWLGSRALLDANSLLHLEHFLPLGKVSPPLWSPEHEWRLNHEIHNAVHKAVRDFVSSWYRTLLPEAEGEFERAVCSSMLESVMELKERARRVDRKALVQQLLQLYGCHLQSYMTARQIQATEKESFSLWKLYSEVDTPHPAVKRPAEELRYSRALVNLFLHVVVPYPQMETRTGGYMVTELITCNVLLPLIHRVSDPDWLNQTILDIITRSREPQKVSVNELPGDPLYLCQNQHESWITCRSQSSLSDGVSSERTVDLDDVQSWSSGCGWDSSQSSTLSLVASGKREPCKMNCCSASCPSSRSKTALLDSLLPSDSTDELTGGLCDCGSPANICNLSLNDEEDFGCFGPLKNFGPKAVAPMDSQWAAGVASEKSATSPSRRPCVTCYNCDASTPQASSVRIQNVHVSGVTATEQRGSSTHPYTLYAVTFETVAEAEIGGAPRRLSNHTVHRRYSEFLNLQTRLEEKSEVKKLIKSETSSLD